MVFLQSSKTDPQEIWDSIPVHAQEIVRKKKIQVVALDTVAIARDVATQADLQQRMQGIVLLGIFLKSAPFLKDFNMTEERLFERVESVIRRFWGRHGEQVVADNLKAIRRGYSEVFEIPRQIIEKTSIVKDLPLTEN